MLCSLAVYKPGGDMLSEKKQGSTPDQAENRALKNCAPGEFFSKVCSAIPHIPCDKAGCRRGIAGIENPRKPLAPMSNGQGRNGGRAACGGNDPGKEKIDQREKDSCHSYRLPYSDQPPQHRKVKAEPSWP